MLVKELEGMSSEELFGTLGLSSLEAKGLRSHLAALYIFLRRNGEGNAGWSLFPGVLCQDVWEWLKAASVRGGLDLTQGNIFSPRG